MNKPYIAPAVNVAFVGTQLPLAVSGGPGANDQSNPTGPPNNARETRHYNVWEDEENENQE